MNRRTLVMLTVAGAAATLQAGATLGAFAWLSRTLPVEGVGRFGLYLAVVSFALALDGVRQVVVVTATNNANEPGPIRQLAAIALLFGATVAAGVAFAGHFLLDLSWAEALPLAATCFCLLALGPGHARIEASGGPHLAVALHSIAWSIALVLGAALAAHDGDARHTAWAMLAAPLIILAVLATRGLLVAPSLRGDGLTRRLASQGIRSHLVTAVSGFLDKGALAIHAGPFALGLYTPLSELTGRASALGGMVANLFLNDETRSTEPGFGVARRSSPHLLLMDAFFVFAAAGIVTGALFAHDVLKMFVARSSPSEVLAFRLLLACLALNIGAQWSAVTLRARGQFDLYRPYTVSLFAALVLAPVLISRAGIVGGAVIVLVLRTADIALIARARPMVSAVQCAAIAAAAIIALALAVSDGIMSGSSI
ncbi:MAG TPA: hypothetical protein PLE54_07145 [Burkholderiaceae bacterium]|nr:hypothetical protein [Burkholderiaceae bacterium]